jgi:hypothetical protein
MTSEVRVVIHFFHFLDTPDEDNLARPSDIVLGSLKKKLAQISDPNPEKGYLLHLDLSRQHLADHEILANNLTSLSHPADILDFAPTDFWLFGHLKMMLEESSFEMAEDLQENGMDTLMQSRHRHSE